MTEDNKPNMITREGEEIWEMCTNGRVWVECTVDKSRGTTKIKNVQGKGSRLRILTEDRKLAQERVREKRHDPFTNGLMVRVDSDQQVEEDTASPSAVSDKELRKIFTYKQQARFISALEDLTEISLRRLWSLVEEDENVSNSQKNQVSELLQSKFGVNRNKADRRHDSPEQIAADFPVMKLSN
jgi:hypothetical protein